MFRGSKQERKQGNTPNSEGNMRIWQPSTVVRQPIQILQRPATK